MKNVHSPKAFLTHFLEVNKIQEIYFSYHCLLMLMIAFKKQRIVY